MVTVTSRRAAPDSKVLKERRKLCEEDLAIERQIAPLAAAREAIRARLKVIAEEAGAPFKEAFADGSYVHVTGPVAAEYKGTVPVIVTEVWLGLSQSEQKAHIKSGLIELEPQWGRASSGRVQIKIFGEAA
jgi:hypothetical protein